MSVKPIKPSEVAKAKLKAPDAVIEAFNECIAFHYVNGSAEFTQKEVLDKIIDKLIVQERRLDVHECVREEVRNRIFREGWLNVEAIYREEGWHVSYDKPGYNESYLARFDFTPKNR